MIACDLRRRPRNWERVNGQFVASFLGGGGLFFDPRSDDGLEEGHHGAQLGAELLDGVALLALASSEEIRAAGFVFRDPFFCKTAVANLAEDLAHLVARFLRDDAGAGSIVAVFGSVTDGITHVAETAPINEIDDELEFMEAFEVGDLGLIACIDEGFEAGLDEFTDAAA